MKRMKEAPKFYLKFPPPPPPPPKKKKNQKNITKAHGLFAVQLELAIQTLSRY